VTFGAQRATQNYREASKIELVNIINHTTHCTHNKPHDTCNTVRFVYFSISEYANAWHKAFQQFSRNEVFPRRSQIGLGRLHSAKAVLR